MDRNPGCEAQVFAWRCCCHRRHSQEVGHLTEMPIACIESMFTVLLERFYVGTYASGQSPSSRQVRYQRQSFDDPGLYHIAPLLLSWCIPLLPGSTGTYLHIVPCIYFYREFLFRYYCNLDRDEINNLYSCLGRTG